MIGILRGLVRIRRPALASACIFALARAAGCRIGTAAQSSDTCADVIDGGTQIEAALGAVALRPGWSAGMNGIDSGGAITLFPIEQPPAGSTPTTMTPLAPITLRTGERAVPLGRTICLVSVHTNGPNSPPGGAGSVTLGVK